MTRSSRLDLRVLNVLSKMAHLHMVLIVPPGQLQLRASSRHQNWGKADQQSLRGHTWVVRHQTIVLQVSHTCPKVDSLISMFRSNITRTGTQPAMPKLC
mmetsp:Transcript_26252/g.36572  ORF Transcript_26252/g.36572 Transcript_26252/m.36572 type:complete len:99 (+) Transcript_26252:2601-2897(+)